MSIITNILYTIGTFGAIGLVLSGIGFAMRLLDPIKLDSTL